MKKINVTADEAIMIGDTPYDIAAAGKAGVKSIGFTCGGWSPDSLRDAIEIYRGPWDLLENLNQSILGRNSKKISEATHSEANKH
jgi:phosphoglycolate phosphatase-like HAD superfamily hydrolase